MLQFRIIQLMLFATLSVSTLTENVVAADDAAKPAGEHNFVMRVTKEHFDNLMQNEFEEVVPLDHLVLSTRITGSSDVRGRVKVELEFDHDEAVFIVVLDGKANSQTVSAERSIRVHAEGETTFHAEKRIYFDGLYYHGKPPVVTLESTSDITDVVSTRSGVVGNLAVSVARRRIPQRQPEMQRIVKERTKESIYEEFDELTNKLIKDLNKTTRVEETIMLLFPETKDWVYSLSTTEEHIQASVGPKGLKFPLLPERANDRRDPIEIWIRKGKVTAKPKLINLWNNAQELLVLAYLAGAELSTVPTKGIKVEEAGHWNVISLESKEVSSVK